MKNNYSSIRNINKTAATIKQFFIAIILVASASFNNAFGVGVVITAPNPPPITDCSFPTVFVPLGNIVIPETSGNDISTYGDLILSAPTNFEFQPSVGTVTFTTSRNILSASINISPSTITVTMTGGGGPLIDAITISGIMVRGINTASGPSNVTRTGGTSVIAGNVNGTVHATISSILNSVTAGVISSAQTICSGGDPLAFTETVAATGSGVLSYSWRHSTDTYGTPLVSSATYDVPGGLAATTTYRRITRSTLNTVACNVNTNDIVVTVNDVTGGYISTPQTVCYNGDPALFTETVASTGSGSLTYQWKHSTDTYTAVLGTTTTYNVPPGLLNTTTYRRITISNLGGVSCAANSSSDITVTVMPLVTGGALSSNQTICNGATPSQLTGPLGSGGDGSYTYLWQQSTTNANTGFTAATFTNTTVNYSPTALSNTTWYRRKVSSAGCNATDSAAIQMTVEVPVVTNLSTSTICSGVLMNIPLTANVSSSFTWTIGTIGGGITGATAGSGNNIIQTLTNPNTSAGSVNYIITPTSTSGLCVGAPFTINVSVKPAPGITNASNITICSGTPTNITLAATPASTFSWTIGGITGGITGAVADVGPNINQLLNNPNPSPGTVPYIVTPTSTSGSCVGNPFTLTVTVNPKPLVTNPSTSTICDMTGPNIALTANVPSMFSLAIGTITGGITGMTQSGPLTTIYHTLTNPGNSVGSVQHMITPTSSSGGCVGDPYTINVNVNPTPTLTSPSSGAVCSGVLYSYTPTSSVTGATFNWSRAVVAGISNIFKTGTNDPSELLINTTTSPVNVTYIYTLSINGCQNPANFNLVTTVNPSPELSTTLSPPAVCSGAPLNYNASSLTPGATFSWTRAAVTGISNPVGSGTILIAETLIDTTASPINVTYIYTTVANGCSKTQNVIVTVNPTPTLNSGLTATICSGMIFNYNPTSATTGATFDWTRAEVPGVSNSISNGTNDPNETLYDTTAFPVNVNYDFTTAANGCGNTETLVVSVDPAPIVTNSANYFSCSGTNPNVTLTANLASNFAWTLGENPGGITGGSNSVGATLNQILTNPSDSTTFSLQYNVTATSISGTCSGNSSAIFINVNPQPLANAGNNSTICSDSSVIIGGAPTATAGTGPYTYSWSPSSGLDSPTLSNPTANPAVSTTYSVTVTDSLGCSASISSMLVTVNPAPNVNAGADVSICIGNNVTLYASGGTTYLWSNGSSADSITVNPTVNTTYSVMGTTNGCSHSDTVLVTINPLPVVNGGNDTTICAEQSIILSGNGNGSPYTWNNGISDGISFTPTATTTYVVSGTLNGCSQYDTILVTVNSLPTVNGGADTIICVGQSVILSGNGNGSPYTWNNGISNGTSFIPTATTTYVVSGTLNGCSNSDTVLVTVNSLPIVGISASAPICEGQSETLTASGGILFAWSTGASTSSITESPATTTTYTVTVTDVNNCSDNTTATVIVNPAPIAYAGADFTICIGDTAALMGDGGISYLWTDGTNTFTTSTILASPIVSTVYSLSVTDGAGCSDYDTAMVNVTPSKDIFGHVSYTGGPVTNGMVVLYKYMQFQTRFDSVQYVPLDPSTGDYVFANVNYGEYLVKVFADSASYPNLINTYYGDEFLWNGDSVHIIDHTCASNTTLGSITMVELTGNGGGTGLISGQIIEGISFGRVEGEPIPGVDVNLGKNPGGIIATTNTDSTGHFTFSGVANGNYTIFVDIPGLGRDSTYTFTLDSTNNQFLNQNYIADSTTVFPNPTSTVGIKDPAKAFENKFSVYPNPVKGNTTIEYSILQMTDSKTTLEVTTALGVKINTLVNAAQQAGTYKYNFNPQNYHLNSGLYFITLTIDGKATTKRIVVIE